MVLNPVAYEPSRGWVEYDVEAAAPMTRQEEAANQISRSFRRSHPRPPDLPTEVAPPRAAHAGVRAAVYADIQAHAAAPSPRGPSQLLKPVLPAAYEPASPKAYDSQAAPMPRQRAGGYAWDLPGTPAAEAAANQIGASFRRSRARRAARHAKRDGPLGRPHEDAALADAAQRYRAAKAQ